MTIKLICIDMDGTLLSSHHEVSEENKQAIMKAVDKGVHVAITTGRLYRNAKLYAKQIGLNTPIIASNGSYIGGTHGEEIYKNTISRDDLNEFFQLMTKLNLYWYVSTSDRLISTHPFPETNVYHALNKTLDKSEQVPLEVAESIDDIFNRYGDQILKAVCVESDDLELLAHAKAHMKSSSDDLEIVSSWFNNFEVLKQGSSKGQAVKALTAYFNLSSEDVMCLGDSENDLSMITYAGLSVAMGNATDQIKQAAHHITTTNDDSGVAKAINQFVL